MKTLGLFLAWNTVSQWSHSLFSLEQVFEWNSAVAHCVLELPWRHFRCGKLVDSEDIFEASRKHKRCETAPTRLRDWYPPCVGELPLAFARLICQRAALWWDLRQRDRVRAALTILLTALAMTVFIIALSRHDTVEQMILTVYVPLSPAVVWILREILAQRDAIHSDEKGLTEVEALWTRAINQTMREEELLTETLLIQDALFDNRSRSPAVFDWVYRLLRKEQEDQMQHKAKELVAEALAASSGTTSVA